MYEEDSVTFHLSALGAGRLIEVQCKGKGLGTSYLCGPSARREEDLCSLF